MDGGRSKCGPPAEGSGLLTSVLLDSLVGFHSLNLHKLRDEWFIDTACALMIIVLLPHQSGCSDDVMFRNSNTFMTHKSNKLVASGLDFLLKVWKMSIAKLTRNGNARHGPSSCSEEPWYVLGVTIQALVIKGRSTGKMGPKCFSSYRHLLLSAFLP